MTVNELINSLYNIDNLDAEILKLKFDNNSSELTVVIAKNDDWEEEYKIKIK